MSTQNCSTAVGVFDSRLEANQAVTELQEAGFGQNQIGVAMRHAPSPVDASRSEDTEDQMDTTSGGLAGVLGGLGLGALAGVGVLTGVIPVVGPAIAAGTLGVILSNAIAGAGIVGLVGALVGAGLPKREAEYYQEQFEAGRIIVTVDAGDRCGEATEILLDNGCHFMTSRGAARTST
jgi:hypothetical protein